MVIFLFSDYEVQRLRSYLQQGGFSMPTMIRNGQAFRREIKKVFPDQELVELPFSYGLYSCHFSFPNGVQSRINTMENHRKGLDWFQKGRLVVYLYV